MKFERFTRRLAWSLKVLVFIKLIQLKNLFRLTLPKRHQYHLHLNLINLGDVAVYLK